MNIVVICDNANMENAPTSQAIAGAVQLAKNGHKVVFFCASLPVHPNLLAQQGIKVLCTVQKTIAQNPNKAAALVQGLWNWPAYFKLIRLLKNMPAQNTLVHVHLWAKGLSPSVFAACAKHNFPVFVSTHEYYSVCPNGALLNYPQKSICRLRPLCLSCIKTQCDRNNFAQKQWRVLRQLIQNKEIKSIKKLKFLAVSQLNHKVLQGVLPKNKVLLNQNFVRLLPKPAKQINFSQNQNYLFIGRLDEEKGIELFCEALRQLGLCGIAIGSASQEKNAALLKIKYPNVKFTGYLSPQQMLPYIKKARALVFCSIWYEGMGLTAYEMQINYSMPCIIAHSTAPAHLAKNGKAGLLFKSGCVQSLKKAILQMQNKALVQAMQNCIAKTNFEEYNLEEYTARLCRFYAEALKQEAAHG